MHEYGLMCQRKYGKIFKVSEAWYGMPHAAALAGGQCAAAFAPANAQLHCQAVQSAFQSYQGADNATVLCALQIYTGNSMTLVSNSCLVSI